LMVCRSLWTFVVWRYGVIVLTSLEEVKCLETLRYGG